MGDLFHFPGSSDEDYPEDLDATYDGPEVDIAEDATVFTLNETAYLLNIPVVDTREGLSNGDIPGVLVGEDWLVWRPRLMAWLNGLPKEGGW